MRGDITRIDWSSRRAMPVAAQYLPQRDNEIGVDFPAWRDSEFFSITEPIGVEYESLLRLESLSNLALAKGVRPAAWWMQPGVFCSKAQSSPRIPPLNFGRDGERRE